MQTPRSRLQPAYSMSSEYSMRFCVFGGAKNKHYHSPTGRGVYAFEQSTQTRMENEEGFSKRWSDGTTIQEALL